jgi:hypothetical protein
MMRVNRIPLNVTQVSQIIDVSAYADAIDAGYVEASFSVWVNSPTIGVESATFLRNLPAPLRPSIETRRREDPMLGPMTLVPFTSTVTHQWQEISGIHPLLPNTRFLHFEFHGRNATISTAGVFFDSASVVLVPEPATLSILALSVAAVVFQFRPRRKTRQIRGS